MQRSTISKSVKAAVCAVALPWLAGCAGGEGLSCEDSERYAASDSIPPVRVPDDLSPPQQEESLRIPPAPPGAAASGEGQPCLEAPPDYFENDENDEAEVG